MCHLCDYGAMFRRGKWSVMHAIPYVYGSIINISSEMLIILSIVKYQYVAVVAHPVVTLIRLELACDHERVGCCGSHQPIA